MDDLISRKDAINAIYHHFTNLSRVEATGILHEVPATDRPIGHWIDIDSEAYTWKVRCDKCGHERSMMSTQGVYPNFCENCGADMRERKEE